jgi:UDP-2,3-diacylglucosamine pyrophosphatase LpxH
MTDLAWCLADPHFERGDPALGTFKRWIDVFLAQDVPNLVLLGDLFHVWVGLPAVETDEQRAVLSTLGRAVAAGRQVVYLRGNRDYFIEGSLSEAGILLQDQWDLGAPGELIRFEHGDLINSSDQNYLRWRELSHSATVSALFQLLPPARQRALAHKLERSLGNTNAYYKTYRPERELNQWASRLASQGVRTAVLGHFHVDESTRLSGVDIRFVPQFREDGAFLRVGADGSTVLQRI